MKTFLGNLFQDNNENTISHQILLFQPTSDLSQRWTWTLQQWRKVQMQTWNITSEEFCILQRFISLWRLQKSVSTINHVHHTFSHHSHSQILCVQKSMKHHLLNSQSWLYNCECKTHHSLFLKWNSKMIIWKPIALLRMPSINK